MADVIDLPATAQAPHRSLTALSRILGVIFTILVVGQIAWVAAAGVGSFFFADHVLVGTSGAIVYAGTPPPLAGTVLYSTQPVSTRLAGLIDIMIATAPILVMFWELRGLFRLYARGVVFARENAQHLKRVGLCLVIYPFAKFAANMIFQAAGGTDRAWFHMDLVWALVLGLIVFAIAQVMEFGREIEQEKDSFV